MLNQVERGPVSCPIGCRVRYWSPECRGDGACSWPGPIPADLGSTTKAILGARHRLSIRRGYPTRDLCPCVEPELVHVAADVGGDGGLGDQQARSDLLVAQSFGDQLRHLDLPLREWSERDLSSSPGLDLIGFAKREAHGRLAASVCLPRTRPRTWTPRACHSPTLWPWPTREHAGQ